VIFKKELYRYLRKKAFNALNLKVRLSSGITISVENKMEWIIYNDIFVEGDYDTAIFESFKKTSVINIVDLGANAGFFILRVGHLAYVHRVHQKINIKAVEASKELCTQLYKRFNISENQSNISIEIIEGLIGSKSGSSEFFQFDNHGLNSVFRKNGKSVSTQHVDLTQVCETFETIDLVKCDIEGSELKFIENYPDILKKTKALIIEFHPEFCDLVACKKALKEYGFGQPQLIKDYGNCSIHYFRKTDNR
jgi:FkbM family methyltransferase